MLAIIERKLGDATTASTLPLDRRETANVSKIALVLTLALRKWTALQAAMEDHAYFLRWGRRRMRILADLRCLYRDAQLSCFSTWTLTPHER